MHQNVLIFEKNWKNRRNVGALPPIPAGLRRLGSLPTNLRVVTPIMLQLLSRAYLQR